MMKGEDNDDADQHISISKQQLITLVKECPVLWNRHNPYYRDQDQKKKAWNSVFRELVPEYDDMKPAHKVEIGQHIQKKWNNLRDAYAKYRKHSASYKRRPYVFAEMLSFLEPMYADKEVTENSDTIEEYLEENTNEGETSFANEVFIEMEEPEGEGSKSKRLKLDTDTLGEEGNVISILANLLQQDNDEDTAFFKSITPTVKSLSENSKLEFRIRVLSVLKDVKEKEKLNNRKFKKSHSDSD